MDKKDFEQRAKETSEYQLAPDGKNNTQLPAEVFECMNDILVDFALAYHKSRNKDIANDSTEYLDHELRKQNALTEYATKLHQAEQAIEEKINNALHAERNKQQKRFTESETAWAGKLYESRQLLEKVIYRHEGGLLPDRLLYNEIKTFLDGKE